MATSDFDLRQLVLDTAADLAVQFLHDDRKEDEELPRGVIESLITRSVVTIDDIVERFAVSLAEHLET